MSAKDGRWKSDGAWWAQVKGYPEYVVSDDGRVVFDNGVTSYRCETYLVNNTVLVRLGMPSDYHSHGYSVARLVAIAHGNMPDGMAELVAAGELDGAPPEAETRGVLGDVMGSRRRDGVEWILVHIDGDVTNVHISNLGWQRKWLPNQIRTLSRAVPVGGAW